MTTSALRPRSVTEIVDAAFQIFRTHFPALVTCSAVAYVPTLVVRLLLVGDLSRFQQVDSARLREMASVTWWTWIATVLSYALMTAVLTVCASQAYLGEELDVGLAVRRVVPRLPGILLATVIVSVLTMLGFALLFMPAFYVTTLGTAMMLPFAALGFLLGVLAAIYVTARYFAVTSALLLEGRGAFSAMSRSAALSRGRKWHIMNALGLVLLIYFVVYAGITLITALLGNFLVQAVLASAATICLYPVVAITGMLLYYDARIRSEGLDIELMADALGPVATPGVS